MIYLKLAIYGNKEQEKTRKNEFILFKFYFFIYFLK